MEGQFCSHNNVIRDTVPALHGAVRDVWFCKDCLKSFLPAPPPEPFVPLDKSLRDKVIEAAKAWLHEQIHDPNSVRNVTCQYTKGALGLTLAIEALQEVEGGND